MNRKVLINRIRNQIKDYKAELELCNPKIRRKYECAINRRYSLLFHLINTDKEKFSLRKIENKFKIRTMR